MKIFLKNSLDFLQILKPRRKCGPHRSMSVHCRQNFSCECEQALNKQINLELFGSYTYLAMAYHFHNIALKGAYKFFKDAYKEETQHAEKLMEYVSKRGGEIIFQDIKAPKLQVQSLLDAMQEALKLERSMNESLLELHVIATKECDANLCDFIENNYLQEQVDAQKQLFDYIQQIKRSQQDVGTYIFDLKLQEDGKLH